MAIRGSIELSSTIGSSAMTSWAGKKCRKCGAPLSYSAYDIVSGEPQENADYWCSNGDPQTGPHDYGVVKH